MMWRSDPSDGPAAHGLPKTTARPDVVEAVEAAMHACRDVGEAPEENGWRSLFYTHLRDQALPALIADGTITPAASLWTGSRLWTDAFREADLSPGDRLVLDIAPSPGFIQVLIAALWEGLTVALLPPGKALADALDEVDARAAVSNDRHPHAWLARGVAGPLAAPEALRTPTYDVVPDARFLLQTSGTTGTPRWVVLSDQNVFSVLASHLPAFTLGNARALSVLPWSHAFGLVLDFFPALLSGAEIIRDPEGGRDPDSLVRLSRTWGATHLSAVPLTLQRLFQTESGAELVRNLQGGIVGGAPISGALAEALSDTRLRVGYGQTEAAPGISLGDRGVWSANYLGTPCGCEVVIDEQQELHFEGPNACIGFWTTDGFDRQPVDRRVATGDRVRQDGDHLFFLGRTDDTFKLSNGKLVHAGAWEARLKDAFSELDDALVFTYDGTNLAVALHAASEASVPSFDDVRDVLDSLRSRLAWITVVYDEQWQATPKGNVARAAMTQALVDAYEQDDLSTTSPRTASA